MPKTNQDSDLIRDLYLKMYYIREVEELIAREYPSQIFRCPVHLSVGQEAVATGVCSALRLGDKVVSTHRSHAHYLAKGGSLLAFFAEIMGKSGGCCEGRGGSMHIFDKNAGFFASIPIVGSSLPIAAGIALADREANRGVVTVAFVGDATIETGQFHEALNIIALFKLPVLIVIEDNKYSTYAKKEARQSMNLSVKNIVQGFGLGYSEASGDDVQLVFQLSRGALKDVRENNPQVLRFDTFRVYEHCGPNRDDDLGYRELGEAEKFVERDPLKIMESKLSSYAFDSTNDPRKELIKRDIEIAFEKAKSLPLAELERTL